MRLLNGTGSDTRQLLIVISSDRGLCGAFNQVVVKRALAHLKACAEGGKDVQILCIGKKAHDVLKRRFAGNILMCWHSVAIKGVIPFAKAKEIGDHILQMFAGDKFDECVVIYNRFKSAISQEVSMKRLIPLEPDDECMTHNGCEFEPSEEEIVEMLLPKNFTTQLFDAILESNASEQASRMAAMDSATRNSSDMISNLNLLYNRTRQAYITKELIEIIAGAEAI
jgi:F-type H+-transporting ATPase subunit gamma